MARCFEEAKRLGRSIRFGDTGPRLLTRLSLESGREWRTIEYTVLSNPSFASFRCSAPIAFDVAPRANGISTFCTPLERDIAALRRVEVAFAAARLAVAPMGRATPGGWMDWRIR